jgi:hypothetical protein
MRLAFVNAGEVEKSRAIAPYRNLKEIVGRASPWLGGKNSESPQPNQSGNRSPEKGNPPGATKHQAGYLSPQTTYSSYTKRKSPQSGLA